MNDPTIDVDHDARVVTITREFAAPRELVFAAMLDPQQLTHFWGPVGAHTPLETIVVEPHPGGRFETVMVADDGSWRAPTKAVYVEIVAPERLSFREPESGMLTESTYVDLGDGRTRVEIRQSEVPEEYRGGDALKGFMSSLDRMDAHLASITPPVR